MQSSKNRVQAKKYVPSARSVALSAEPVLHSKLAEGSKAKAVSVDLAVQRDSGPAALEKSAYNVGDAAYNVSGLASGSATAAGGGGWGTGGDVAGEQYTYVTDESGYTWLYDTVYGQYYYYDAAKGQYVAYGDAGCSNTAPSQQRSVGEQGGAEGAAAATDKGKHAKKRRCVRMAGGQVWEDSTLDEWPADDYRLFAGDLGPEVTTELLEQVFGKFRSLQKTHVVMDKKTGKSRGYGFLSFGDADEFLAAWKEFNGKYVGSRPISLRRSSWKDRNADIRKVKRQDKRAFLEFKRGGGGG
ncbi:hypothetical protein GGI04_002469 [Coemansia thaxteri]|uniref:RRM domain-containing protein n=1 Tax=Coemansia thaxteri TaxID=2663907 RepID=A0A9W8EGK0_9FUNG|nr:hypothetical protein GGI04_002469 [Coemansia thaxteri]KAJ2005720.1 hypothetical protein H4R26_001805 [Coemansia thaxteri]KAJ2470271.1 hypothetical protein GGI02_003038 [Coemansia sp. RSA 2322]KAJ2478841.1 hypothetical protein EV174_004193 [Coemansia sp. RSA 2320]